VAHDLSVLLALLADVMRGDEARDVQTQAAAALTEAIAPSLMWVHRTGKAADWRHVFDARRLGAQEAGTRFELALGLARAV
jgi:hypothetical protein